jgi:aminoglycoside phosphotransferase (APT) family kinase protein
VTAFEIERADGRIEKLVVRRHGDRDMSRNPQIAADEFRLLQLLAASGLPVPTPRLSAPCLVLDYVEGEGASDVDATELITALAGVLAEIHRVGATPDVSFLPERSLDSGEPRPRRNRPVLLHGDFWPGNTLWKDGRLVAVLDWEDAAVGDPLADVANARLELLWALGTEAMDDFTDRYESHAPGVDFTDLPHWDLWADLRLSGRMSEWGLDEATERAMRAGHQAFVAQALAKLRST